MKLFRVAKYIRPDIERAEERLSKITRRLEESVKEADREIARISGPSDKLSECTDNSQEKDDQHGAQK